MTSRTELERLAQRERHETETLWQRLRFYFTPIDARYEDLTKGTWYLNVFRDFTAGLIVAMVAIPLAMGLAMASGLPPAMGIVGGAVAGLIGALFGGSKYQVYGPTAAFIPVIMGITSNYGGTPENPNYDFLIWCSIISGLVLMAMGLARLGRLVARVPDSIVVGFTIGIAIVIAMSQVEQVLGYKSKLAYGFANKIQGIVEYFGEFNIYAFLIAAMTFFVIKYLLKVSKFIPAPLIAVGLALLVSQTIWSGMGLPVVQDKFGPIPENLIRVTLPGALALTPSVIFDIFYFVVAIVFVSGVESLLCSRMADRLADNRGTPYNPNKELWGQGWVQTLVVLFNGFPHTGALARTATNIKVGAVSPLAGIFKFGLKLLLAVFLARWLDIVPMACIGGILVFVAVNMVKPAEVREVWRHNRFHASLMVYTAVMVAVTDFLIGVLSALALYGLLHRFLDRSPPRPDPESVEPLRAPAEHAALAASAPHSWAESQPS
ncbi:MAG: SulP family inorganic anion transporter [Pirellulales bacterium]